MSKFTIAELMEGNGYETKEDEIFKLNGLYWSDDNKNYFAFDGEFGFALNGNDEVADFGEDIHKYQNDEFISRKLKIDQYDECKGHFSQLLNEYDNLERGLKDLDSVNAFLQSHDNLLVSRLLTRIEVRENKNFNINIIKNILDSSIVIGNYYDLHLIKKLDNFKEYNPTTKELTLTTFNKEEVTISADWEECGAITGETPVYIRFEIEEKAPKPKIMTHYNKILLCNSKGEFSILPNQIILINDLSISSAFFEFEKCFQVNFTNNCYVYDAYDGFEIDNIQEHLEVINIDDILAILIKEDFRIFDLNTYVSETYGLGLVVGVNKDYFINNELELFKLEEVKAFDEAE